MPRKLKRTSIALTDENWNQLKLLMDDFGENRSEVIKKSLTLLYYTTFMKENKYVSISGNDKTGDGSIERPFQTIQRALSSIKNADEKNLFKVVVLDDPKKIEEVYNINKVN